MGIHLDRDRGRLGPMRGKGNPGAKARVVVMIFPLLCFIGCGPRPQRPGNTTPAEGRLSCNYEDFGSLSETSQLKEIRTPFFVRRVSGTIVNEVAADGTWPEGAHVLIELKPSGKGGQVRSTYADEHGRFIFENVRDGRYCFLTRLIGWESAMGTIVVSKKADPRNAITISVRWPL